MSDKNEDNYLELNDGDFEKLTNSFIKKTNKINKNDKPLFTKEEEKLIEHVLENEKEDIKLNSKEQATFLIHSLNKEMMKTNDKNNDLNKKIINDI
tara:strand:- start:280 stop:567 length:288 start_codon:yes stop_codon:yes gene_type:complete